MSNKGEQGSVLLLALMMMLVFSIMAITILELAVIEKKVSHYAVYSQAAQQANDAGIEWAQEALWQASLPVEWADTLILEDDLAVQVQVSEKNQLPNDPESAKKRCRYLLIANSNCHGARQELEVELEYSYDSLGDPCYEYASLNSYTPK